MNSQMSGQCLYTIPNNIVHIFEPLTNNIAYIILRVGLCFFSVFFSVFFFQCMNCFFFVQHQTGYRVKHKYIVQLVREIQGTVNTSQLSTSTLDPAVI